MIGLIITLYIYIDNITDKTSLENGFEDNQLTEAEILAYIEEDYDALLEKVRNIQSSPDLTTKFNCLVTKMLYSGKLTETQIELLVSLERETYHQEMLAKNPIEVQIERLNVELERYAEIGTDGNRIIGYKTISPDYFESDDGEEMAMVKVLYYFNNVNAVADGENGENGNVYKAYILEKNNESLWEIKGWANTEEFIIID
jgi:hypothetical protein